MHITAFPADRSVARMFSLAACSVITIPHAAAQSAPANQAGADSNSLEHIIVTAPRKTNSANVPLSVACLSRAALARDFAQIDTRLAMTPEGGPWMLALFGKKLKDKLSSDQTSDTSIITGSHFTKPNRGRQIGLQLGFKI